MEDGSGGEAYYYGRQGEVTKTVCTVVASTADIRTWVYGATYDSWNRERTMTYPDGEVVTYHYNAAGQIESLTGNKLGKQSVIVKKIGYDKEGRTVMDNKYRYDAVDNILGISNVVNPQSLNKHNPAKLGGAFTHSYQYDDLNRLISATGKAKNASYQMQMTFGKMSEPLTKVQKVDSTETAKSYNLAYKYEDENHPTAPTEIGHEHYTYDANGNPILVENDSTNESREMYWDEENRLMVLKDNNGINRYTYNAAGERTMKVSGSMEGVYINGAPQGIAFHETDNFTLYPASILTVNKTRFTKHYFIGSQRIASKIGTGQFNNVYGRNGSHVTAGEKDYAARLNEIESQKEEYYKQLGVAPGVPTMKGAYGDPENTGVGYNAVLTELGNHDVPQGWIQTPRPNTTPNTNPGPPVSWNDPSTPDDPQAGYGYIPNDTTCEETFFYHSDHLGSTSYITDDKANITQYDAYLPYGELLVDEHSSSEDLPYKFNGKQFDEETGLYYYGARYMNPMASIWYGVDPLAEKYPNVNGYCYTMDNPIKYLDPNGKQSENSIILARNPLGGYYFTPAAAHLLHLVSGVNEQQILYANVIFEETGILNGSIGTAGSSLTAGKDPDHAIITHYYYNFKNNMTYRETNGAFFYEFTERNAHEVGHIPQLKGTRHLVGSVYQYLRNILSGQNWHDGSYSTKEKEADKGAITFRKFSAFIDKNYKKKGLEKLFKNKNNFQDQIIERLDQWWKAFITNKFGKKSESKTKKR